MKITAEEIKYARKQFDCGLLQAKRILLRMKIEQAIEDAKTVEDLKESLLAILKII